MQIPSRARVVDITARGVGLDIRGRKGLVCFSPLSRRNFQGIVRLEQYKTYNYKTTAKQDRHSSKSKEPK